MEALEAAKAIREAIRAGDAAEVERLLHAHPAILNHQSVFGSWLHVAAGMGSLEVVKLLLRLGADVNLQGGIDGGNPLHLAASEGRIEVVKHLLSVGAEMDLREPMWNPLFGAIHGGHTSVVQLLIDSGIDVSVKYSGTQMRDMDALAYARAGGRSDIALMLPGHEHPSTGGYR